MAAMVSIRADDPRAVAAVEAIHAGDVQALERLLVDHPDLATARFTDFSCGDERTLLHVVTDWPGHFPNGRGIVAALVAAGADVNAPFGGSHAETPLHWAASSDDIEVLDALVEAGADVAASGSVIDGGGPLSDAVGFGQARAASRLIEHGAQTNLWQAAGLGLVERLELLLAADPPHTRDEITNAFWCACQGGQREAAQRLLESGADINWIGHDALTPLDAAMRGDAADLAEWLRSHGARRAAESA
jgi:ankyrin repeat protein